MNTLVLAASLVSFAGAAVLRCGPFFDMQGCPYNADQVSGIVQYCSRWGFCGESSLYEQQQTQGHYIFSRTLDGSISPDDVCTNRADPGAFCDNIYPGATCSTSDTRCEVFNIAPANLAATGNYELVVVRCGPFFKNMACPVNADGRGTVQYCSKFGFCSSSADFAQAQAAGRYIMSRTLDGSIDPADVCTSDPSPNDFCQKFHANATCNKDEMRCELRDVNATSLAKYVAGAWTLPPAKVSLAAQSGASSGATVTKARDDESAASALPCIAAVVFIAITFLIRL